MDNTKHRHGCLLSYLLFMIVVSSFSSIKYLNLIFINHANASKVGFIFFLLNAIVSLISCIALFKWKKWGFWGFILTGVSVIVYYVLIGAIQAALYAFILDLLVISPLWIALQAGGEHKGWSQLE